MGVCRVAFTDSEGILHSVEVEADPLYEAGSPLPSPNSGATKRRQLSQVP